jgi:hypothetical protein
MSVLNNIGILLARPLNGAVFVALATRKSRPRLRARLFHWVIRNEPRDRTIAVDNLRTLDTTAAASALPDSREPPLASPAYGRCPLGSAIGARTHGSPPQAPAQGFGQSPIALGAG